MRFDESGVATVQTAKLQILFPNLSCSRLLFAPYSFRFPQVSKGFGEDQNVFMTYRDKLGVILPPFLPDHICDEVFLAEDFVAHAAEILDFVIVNADKNHPI